jgi:hypothetical protein
MAKRNDIEEGVLERWGIKALVGETNDPQEAPWAFLRKLAKILQRSGLNALTDTIRTS